MTERARETGILVLNKHPGVTSRAVVDRVARLVPRAKVGHAGTLDPLASGILLICIGAATRLVEMLQQPSKTYQTKIRLGGAATLSTPTAGSQSKQRRVPRRPTRSSRS